ncbi:gamma-tubulin complex component 2-like isoform X1 [Frankliniella occidentalis]|uniref:Gamma-tubulin complex component n=1 Tax=Frankliniella occidentalis TaxID=133901 RepID=A0A9C6WXX8_FRAOC|nr:gamma-tubulin complex component 2-like isoform X1 [Frankliniella occidentalis]
MSEYRVHWLVQELITALGVTSSAEEFVESLHINSSDTVSGSVLQSNLRQVSQRSPNPDAFISKYEELKSKQISSLPHIIALLYQITQDKKLKDYLYRKAVSSGRSESASSLSTPKVLSDSRTVSSHVDGQNLPEIVTRVKKAASVSKRSSQRYKDLERKIRHPSYQAPVVPDWGKLRPHMGLDFGIEVLSPRPLQDVPMYSQETKLMEDLLYVLSGLEGEYIVPHPPLEPNQLRTFAVSEGVDPSLRQLVEKILPLASYYSIIVRFIEEKSSYHHGQVNQSLAGAMNLLIHEYKVFLAQLEMHIRHENVNLQSIRFYSQPTLRTMEILANIAITINKAGAQGGKVLSLLHEQTVSAGDPKVRKLCMHLTQAASVPYMEILQKWIYIGVIQDPYEEFLVEDNELIQREDRPANYSDDYWAKCYIICRDRVPIFLEKISDVILRTGKYLNVIRQCGRNVKSPQSQELKYTIAESEYVEAIEQAYCFASQTLLDLLIKEYDLMGRLRSVKHYFLHDQGDFIVQLMDMCEGELSKNINDIVPHRLESLLELALRTSTANSDPYKDDMRAELLPFDLVHQMFKIHGIQNQELSESCSPDKLTGLESFSFGYEVRWPVSLVLNYNTKACYQMIFRHLFYCKHVERLLCRVWLSNKVCKMFPVSSSQSYRPAFILRQRMLNCVQNLQYYMMVEVIEPNWHNFLEKINKVTNVDQVLACHSDFLSSCIKDCMLTNPGLLKMVNVLIGVCVSFCRFFENAQKYFVDAELNSMIAPSDAESDVSEAAPSIECSTSALGENFEDSIRNFDEQFSAALISLLNKIDELAMEDNNEKMLNVLYRMDFNSYYTSFLVPSVGGSSQTDQTGVSHTSG